MINLFGYEERKRHSVLRKNLIRVQNNSSGDLQNYATKRLDEIDDASIAAREEGWFFGVITGIGIAVLLATKIKK